MNYRFCQTALADAVFARFDAGLRYLSKSMLLMTEQFLKLQPVGHTCKEYLTGLISDNLELTKTPNAPSMQIVMC